VSVGVLALLTAAWADHGDATRAAPASPLTYALMWAAVVLLLGVAVVAIVTALTRRGRQE
jgi:multisubunit Na+/H+ antiporter MnhC subunit